jgi:murein DD-endopeptidase MepM/ murein hydrolase activator NlpD
MQLMITHGSVARSRVIHLSRWQLALGVLALAALLMLLSGAVYHFVFLKAAREGWPVVSQVVRLVVRDEIAQRDRFMRENLDAMAQRVGEMQAKLVRLEAVGLRVVGLAGVKPEDLRPAERGTVPGAAPAAAPVAGPGRGGPYVPLEAPSLEQLRQTIEGLDVAADQSLDVFTLAESRLLESRLAALMIPSAAPVAVAAGSGFGFRADPFTGRPALHTGLDFPAEVGTPIHAAAGGIVVAREWHPAYGHVLEIDHGNGLATRYAHCASIDVEIGTVVRRGQAVAKVGNSGRSTGPHLHFEVLLDGVPQDPARFLAGGSRLATEFAARPAPRRPGTVPAKPPG